MTAAKLIAPVIESSFAVGFDWCIERVKESLYAELASELEITKALTFLKQNEIARVSIVEVNKCALRTLPFYFMTKSRIGRILWLIMSPMAVIYKPGWSLPTLFLLPPGHRDIQGVWQERQ